MKHINQQVSKCIWLIIILIFPCICNAIPLDIYQITNNSYNDLYPSLWGNNIAWTSYAYTGPSEPRGYVYYGTEDSSGSFSTQIIPDSAILDNTTRPSLHDGTIAWHDGYTNGDLKYWNGSETITVPNSNVFSGEISNHDGSVAFTSGAGANNGVRVTVWNGNTLETVSDLWGGWLSMYDGEVAFSGTEGNGSQHYLYVNDGTNTTQIDETFFNIQASPVPSLYQDSLAWLYAGDLFFMNDYTDPTSIRQLTTGVYIDWHASLYDGIIVFSASDGHDKELYLWDGTVFKQITDNEYDDEKPSLFEDAVAWVGFDGEDKEIFFAENLTEADLDIITAFDYNGIPQGGNPIPEPTTILLFGLGLIGLAGVNRKKQ